MDIPGVDVSNNNTTGPIPADAQFVFAKASESVNFDDRAFEGWIAQAKARGIPWGPYHFAHPDVNSADAEAAWFLKNAQRGPLGWALDIENRGNINPLTILGPDRLTAWCERFRAIVEPVLGRSWFYTFRSDATVLFPRLSAEWFIWLATGQAVPTYPVYPVNGGRTVHIEQLGIVGGFDRNVAHIPLTDTPASGDDDMVPPVIFQLADNGDLVVIPAGGARPWVAQAADASLIAVFVFRVLEPDPTKKYAFPNPIPQIADPAQIKEIRGWVASVASVPGGTPLKLALTGTASP